MNPLPPLDRIARLDRLRAAFADAGIDALLVTDLANIRYLTGFTGSAATVVVGHDDVMFLTDGRYRYMATDQLAEAEVTANLVVDQPAGQMEALSRRCHGTRVGCEAADMTVARRHALETSIGMTLVPTTGLIERLRRRKDDGEIARIRQAAAIAAKVLAQVITTITPATTELEIAVGMEAQMRLAGAEGPAFDTIVAAGPNGANAHAIPGRVAIGGRPVVVDFGATIDGYRSDTTRTIATGPVGAEVAEAWAAVYASQQAGVALLTSGRPTHEIDHACRRALAAADLDKYFTTGTGHGVGLVIHEDPFIRRLEGPDTLEVGDVVTVEPGVYLRGKFGIRIEDFYVVTSTGADRLSPAELTPLVA